MKRLAFSFVTGLALMVISAVPVFADEAMPSPDPNVSQASESTLAEGAISTPIDLSAWFSAEQLTLLSAEDQKTLVDKLNALTSDPIAFKKKVKQIREWLSERLEEQEEKMENQAQWEAKQKAKFEAKMDAQFEKLMREKKDAAERARLMQEKEKQMKRMEEKRVRLEAERARRYAKPKVLQAWVASVDTTNGIIVLKKEGAQAKVLVNAKTVLTVVEDDGARIGTLADFQTGDRIFGLVRRNPNNHSLIGVVLIKMQARDVDDDDEAADSGTTQPPADSGSAPPATN